MRVLKWTPEFDAYCESLIAAIWCNLIGLPIHLYDQYALFAIVKLLGTPIQVDRPTVDKSRLSFARIFIEIDITKPPPEEIILDICGREMVQQIRWEKIPAYCKEYKHVGHSSEVCYAAGKMTRPEKMNYNMEPPKQKQQGGQGTKGNQEQAQQNPKDIEKGRQGKNKGKGSANVDGAADHGEPCTVAPKEMTNQIPGWVGPDILGATQDAYHGEPRDHGGRGGGEGRKGLGDGMAVDRVYNPQ